MQSAHLFQINTSSGTPVFQQIFEQVQRLTARGNLKPGDVLPSTRELARHFSINPMTVSKAYNQLEAQGFLIRKKGIGMLVADAAALDKNALLAPVLDEAISQAQQLGLSLDETIKQLKAIWRRDD